MRGHQVFALECRPEVLLERLPRDPQRTSLADPVRLEASVADSPIDRRAVLPNPCGDLVDGHQVGCSTVMHPHGSLAPWTECKTRTREGCAASRHGDVRRVRRLLHDHAAEHARPRGAGQRAPLLRLPLRRTRPARAGEGVAGVAGVVGRPARARPGARVVADDLGPRGVARAWPKRLRSKRLDCEAGMAEPVY